MEDGTQAASNTRATGQAICEINLPNFYSFSWGLAHPFVDNFLVLSRLDKKKEPWTKGQSSILGRKVKVQSLLR